jgi:hypothetical protein
VRDPAGWPGLRDGQRDRLEYRRIGREGRRPSSTLLDLSSKLAATTKPGRGQTAQQGPSPRSRGQPLFVSLHPSLRDRHHCLVHFGRRDRHQRRNNGNVRCSPKSVASATATRRRRAHGHGSSRLGSAKAARPSPPASLLSDKLSQGRASTPDPTYHTSFWRSRII